MDYPLCDQTVTVYRRSADSVLRQVVHGCYLQLQEQLHTDRVCEKRRSFFLLMPGACQRVFPGDRVMGGYGPPVDVSGWDAFVPPAVEGLVQVQQVKPCYLDGILCHTEAC